MGTIEYREFYNQIKKDGVFLDYVLAKVDCEKQVFDRGVSYKPENNQVFFLLEGAFLLMEDSHCYHYHQKKDFFYWPQNLEQFELHFITRSKVLIFDEEEFLMILEKEGVLSYFFFLMLESKLDFQYLTIRKRRSFNADHYHLRRIFLLFLGDREIDVTQDIALPPWITLEVLSAVSGMSVAKVRSLLMSMKEQNWLSSTGKRKIMTRKLLDFLLEEKNKRLGSLVISRKKQV
ncbi:hypothetical protein [Listeria booriae]|uniref:hypothetical protein n=1 Tax=Listeria booriae TaxID=1552123 RepID=UPI001624E9E6|nr:hypothetical protein [Listeria booriae]MBC2149686.1 hypothetical protein [Listeria booriae]